MTAQTIKPKQLDTKHQSAYRAMHREAKYLLELCGENASMIHDFPSPDLATTDDEDNLANLRYHLNQAIDILDKIKS